VRKLLKKDFILSKTEFVAYLKCPFQFYLMKEMHKSKGRRKESLNYIDYEWFLRDGIENHLWLQTFYENYSIDIQKNVYPKLKKSDKKDSWKMAFIDNEIKRFRQAPDFWEPLAVELFLQNDFLCGKADRIDKLDNQGCCRIVEYKSSPSDFEEKELLFYTLLLTNLLPNENLPNITNVSEIGIYNYKTNEFYIAQVTAEKVDLFSNYLKEIRAKMLDPRMIKKKKDCDYATTKCLYREICQRIHIKHQKIIGLSKA